MKLADKEELLKVLDENGNFTGEYKNRSEIHNNKLFHNEVALWIIDKENKKVLLQRRSPNKSQNPNKLALCAGHVVGDETIEEALLKEAYEEVGIDLTMYDYKPLITIKRTEPRNHCYSHHFYVFANIPLETIAIQEEELSGVLYMDFNELKSRVQNGDQEFVFQWNEMYKMLFEKLENVIFN